MSLHLLDKHPDVHHADVVRKVLLLAAGALPHLGEVAWVEEDRHDLGRLQLLADKERQLPAALSTAPGRLRHLAAFVPHVQISMQQRRLFGKSQSGKSHTLRTEKLFRNT